VDEQGLDVERLPPGPVSLAYVTPSRQNPIGSIMPQARRTALIAWARQAGAYLIEDDSDGDLRYQGATHAPLAAMDPYGLVFYIGSFAKTLGAGLNLAFLLAPPELAADIVSIKAMASEGGQAFEQMVVANLLASGEYDHHLRRLRKIYLDRRDAVMETLKGRCGGVALLGTEAGTQMTWLLPNGVSAAAVCEAAMARGVRVAAVTEDAANSSRFHDRALILGYAGLAPERLREGVALLAESLAAAA